MIWMLVSRAALGKEKPRSMTPLITLNWVVTAQMPRASTATASPANVFSLANTRKPMRTSWVKLSMNMGVTDRGWLRLLARRGRIQLGEVVCKGMRRAENFKRPLFPAGRRSLNPRREYRGLAPRGGGGFRQIHENDPTDRPAGDDQKIGGGSAGRITARRHGDGANHRKDRATRVENR